MRDWLASALEYLPQWLGFQIRQSRQSGAALAIADGGAVVLERAFGLANVRTGEALTPQHRFRVASHSKTFTAAGIMRLVEAGRLRLDDEAGVHVTGLHPEIATATIRQLLTHSAGVIRDGTDAGQWMLRRPFLNEVELRAALADAPAIAPNTRFKYSNHGFGLLGLIIEAATGERYVDWIRREVVQASGLEATEPDAPLPVGTPLSAGHSTELLLGERLTIPADIATNALASATGFASTAGDLARFMGSLLPQAQRSILSVASRRELTRPQWSIPDVPAPRDYGLGTIGGMVGDWRWFGHSGGFPGFLTHTAALAGQNIVVSILTNSNDAPPALLVDGAIRILQAFERNGAPTPALAGWQGRWWNFAGATDVVAFRDKVLLAAPGQLDPFANVSELTVRDADNATITRAGGFLNHGEAVRFERDAQKQPTALWAGGTKLLPEAAAAAEMKRRLGAG